MRNTKVLIGQQTIDLPSSKPVNVLALKSIESSLDGVQKADYIIDELTQPINKQSSVRI